tara:strand:+ start:114 stop:431 length:318 start_codon:yes stop_codon:yes gene_type:complete
MLFNFLKKTKENFVEEFQQQSNEMGVGGAIMSIIFCLLTLAYTVYLVKFQIECIIYEGVKDNKIDWFGKIVPTLLLFACCGPCMVVYRFFNRCKPKMENTYNPVF